MSSEEEMDGFAFEARGVEVARAIHDPLGLQGAVIYEGRERDALFVGNSTIHAFEFTTRRDKGKAVQDVEKLAAMLKSLSRLRENKFKSLQGWFVTRDEPTPDQRTAVQQISKRLNVSIHAVSLATLRQQVCDVRGYLARRDVAPFGSAAYKFGDIKSLEVKVTPRIQIDLETNDPKTLASKVVSGSRILMLGEFGVGKSYTLRAVYEELRRTARRDDVAESFPIHINLRDCAGLRTPSEILRRHAEEIAFGDSAGLISAWRSGAAVLLLDGFDEVVPTRWMGPAANLRQVRWEALSAIRRLIQESPDDAGIMVCGRSHYFSSTSEMLEVLGLSPSDTTVCKVDDFTPQQLTEYLEKSGFSGAIPDWIPTRPLLVSYLISSDSVSEALGAIASSSRAQAWRQLFSAICSRESRIYTAVPPRTIEQIIARVATLARSRGDELGPLEMAQMQQAYYEINGYQPDEEGTQLLLRLPGLAVRDDSESRIFVDRDLAAVAYGEDLAEFVKNPYDSRHPLSAAASWVTAASDLSIEVSAMALSGEVNRRAIMAIANRRQDNGYLDAVLADLISLLALAEGESRMTSFLIEGVLFENLSPGDHNDVLSSVHISSCVIDTLDLSTVATVDDMPTLSSSLIGYVDGMESIPSWLQGRFINCEIESFAKASATTAGILRLGFSDDVAVALTILKKVYRQRGSGRKEQALYRGLDQTRRDVVSEVIVKLVSHGWIAKSGTGDRAQYVPVKERRADALQILESPATFSW